MKYRMYIDEVGNSDLASSENPNHRYLSLTGVIIELDYVRTVVAPAIESLKNKFFNQHPDDPIILHRRELMNGKPPFHALKDKTIRALFDKDFLHLLRDLNFTVITVVIDKLEHKEKYSVWHHDPYHYCLSVLVERFVLWLQNNKCEGDVFAESRGGKEDLRLKNSFRRLIESGTDFVSPESFDSHLTSKELKVKLKKLNVTGLQLADLIAYPSYRSVLSDHTNNRPPENFGAEVVKILEKDKYNRSKSGRIEGYGKKWLP